MGVSHPCESREPALQGRSLNHPAGTQIIIANLVYLSYFFKTETIHDAEKSGFIKALF